MVKRALEETEETPRTVGLSWKKRVKQTLPTITPSGARAVPVYRPEDEDDGDKIGKKKKKRLEAEQKKAQKEKQKKLAQERESWKNAPDPTLPLIDICKREGLPQVRVVLVKMAEKIQSKPEKFLETYFPAFFKIQDAIYAPGADFAALSAIAVIADLLPSAKVGDQEHLQAVHLSLRAESQRKYDKTLLAMYSETLTRLIVGVKKQPKVYGNALASLARAAFHFNQHRRLLNALTNTAAKGERGTEECLHTVRHIFEHDASLEASMDIVDALSLLARGREKLSAELIDSLLTLRLDRSEDAAVHEEDADEEIMREFQEAQIRYSSKHLKKLEVKILTEIIVLFLRVLRTKQLHSSEVIAACLRGLANKALLVNIELLVEILEELRLVIEEAIVQYDSRVALLGIHCAFALLQGPGRALTTNMSWLGNAFVQALALALPYIPDQDKVLMPCVEGARVPQVFPKESMANHALVQEALFAVITHLEPESGLKAFTHAEQQLRRFGAKLSPILDVDGGLFGVGGARERPISVFWHIRALQHHLLPHLRESAQALQPQTGQLLRKTAVVAPTCQLLTSCDLLDLPFPPKVKKPVRSQFWSFDDLMKCSSIHA